MRRPERRQQVAVRLACLDRRPGPGRAALPQAKRGGRYDSLRGPTSSLRSSDPSVSPGIDLLDPLARVGGTPPALPSLGDFALRVVGHLPEHPGAPVSWDKR